jgi:hypothetical protein
MSGWVTALGVGEASCAPDARDTEALKATAVVLARRCRRVMPALHLGFTGLTRR